MRWEGERESENVEDRRGMSGGTKLAGGGIATLVIALIVWLMGGDPRQVLQNAPPSGGSAQTSSLDKGTEDRLAKFVKVVLADTEDVWHEQFRQMNRVYREPTLVLFTGRVDSACGMAGSATGPFYCPGDEKLYIDLSFYEELQRRFKAPGDFAQAYVVAHEVGHHIQKLLGTMDKVDARRRQLTKTQANQLSVRLELQADFYAGVWAYHAQRTKKILEPGDLEEALRAATAIGDDAIQKQAQGYVVPDAFTHGTSRQRVAWFRKGFQTGDIKQGDTFNMPDPE